MAEDIVVPTLGESVTEATVAKWFKSPGDAVAVDEPLLELETDKVSVEVNAKAAGVLSEIVADAGAEVEVGAVLGRIDANGKGAAPKVKTEAPAPKAVPAPSKTQSPKDDAETSEPVPVPAPSAAADMPLAPAVRKLVEDNRLDPAKIPASGKDGRLTKGDVLAHIEKGGAETSTAAPKAAPAALRESSPRETGPREERVKMTRLRRRIAERLKEAQNTAAMLTTFNEADMSAVMALRNRLQDSFVKKHGVKLGFMSFFVKACMVALREVPEVNAEISGDDIIYKNHYDIGVAVSTENGLIVPVLRDADAMSFADIESKIAELANRARDGKLAMEDLTGGTFTITNGGIFGSLLSTPILNPPQSGILGMHAIVKRPVAVGDNIEIRPMMNLALSYDHRIVDGREAVTFLVRVKECIEQPERILLDI